jgi:hypothetical protein
MRGRFSRKTSEVGDDIESNDVEKGRNDMIVITTVAITIRVHYKNWMCLHTMSMKSVRLIRKQPQAMMI